MPESKRVSTEIKTILLEEYRLIAESWRFLTGIRFALLTFTATVLFALLGGYTYVNANIKQLGDIGYRALGAIPIFGLLTTFAIIAIEERTRNLYATCLARGMKLEIELGIKSDFIREGHFHRLWDAPLFMGFATHTVALRIIYGSIAGTWTYLGIRALVL